MFLVAAYAGAQLPGSSSGLSGALLALTTIILPGFLLVAGVLPMRRSIWRRPLAVRAMAGTNVTLVGLLAAALHGPVFTSAIEGPTGFAIALSALLLLRAWRRSGPVIVGWCVLASVAAGYLRSI